MKTILKSTINIIEKEILDFYQMVKQQHQEALKLFLSGNWHQKQNIIDTECLIDARYDRLLKNTFYNLAQYSFFGSHLRKVLSYSYIANEIERIADHGQDIIASTTKTTLTAVQTTMLEKIWKQLLLQFGKVERLFFVKDEELLFKFLHTATNHKIDFQSWTKHFNDKEKDGSAPAGQIFAFFGKIHALDRCFARLTNIVEYLLLIRSFPKFWKYRKQVS